MIVTVAQREIVEQEDFRLYLIGGKKTVSPENLKGNIHCGGFFVIAWVCRSACVPAFCVCACACEC